jgi:PAS domain S-box-containing protein
VSRAIEWIVLGCVGVAAIIVGVRWHRPARIGPWLLLAAAMASLAIGDVWYALGRRGPADLYYMAMFALVGLGLLQLTRGGVLLVDRARLLDMLAALCSALLVTWVFVIGASGRFGAISAADVIGDVLLLGVALRLAVAGNRSAILLATGATGMLVSDIAYPIAPGTLTEAGHIVLYLAWGAAALHPSMIRLTEPSTPCPTPWRIQAAALLGVSVATPPLVLLIEALSGTVRDGLVIAVAGGITLTLAITRLTDSLARHSQALSRERGLREAGAALVAAADPLAVDRAVRAGIAHLMPPAAVQDVVFADDDQPLTAESLPPATTGPRPRSWWAGDPDRTTGTATLVCPLWLEPRSASRPDGGALIVTGRREHLLASRDTLEVLAGHAALALDRISLVDAVGRRDSEQFLRTVIRNTADIMLVIDENHRIRYTSPACRGMLGQADLPPLATLGDLIHHGDRAQVDQALRTGGDGVVYCAVQRPDGSQVLVEATYRDLRADRLVRGFVVTMRDVTDGRSPDERIPDLDRVDGLPAWLNRRSAQHRFRY